MQFAANAGMFNDEFQAFWSESAAAAWIDRGSPVTTDDDHLQMPTINPPLSCGYRLRPPGTKVPMCSDCLSQSCEGECRPPIVPAVSG